MPGFMPYIREIKYRRNEDILNKQERMIFPHFTKRVTGKNVSSVQLHISKVIVDHYVFDGKCM